MGFSTLWGFTMTTVAAPRSVAPLGEAQPVVSSEGVASLIRLWRGDQRARFTLSTPDPDHRSAVTSLGLDLLDARLRQVHFFDTRDVTLSREGIRVWLTRSQCSPATAGVDAHGIDDLAEPLRDAERVSSLPRS
jgi:hypothetical protein